MPKTVSAHEAKNRLGSLFGYVSDHDDEVIVESHGKPRAVIMSIPAYKEVQALRERKRRTDALERLRQLHGRVAARNQDLTEIVAPVPLPGTRPSSCRVNAGSSPSLSVPALPARA